MTLGELLDYLGRRKTLENLIGLSGVMRGKLYQAEVSLAVAISQDFGDYDIHNLLNTDMKTQVGPRTLVALEILKNSTAL